MRIELDGIAEGTVQDFCAIFDLLALPAVVPLLDVVKSLEMEFNFAVHQDLIAEFAVGLDDSRVQVAVLANSYLLEDIDAIFAARVVATFGHGRKPLGTPGTRREVASNKEHNRHHGL